MQRRKGLPIPRGWAQDKDGNVTTDAKVGYEAGCLMPLGGGEMHSGFKGSGLALMLEVLGAILAGTVKEIELLLGYSRRVHKNLIDLDLVYFVSRWILWSVR